MQGMGIFRYILRFFAKKEKSKRPSFERAFVRIKVSYTLKFTEVEPGSS